MAEDTAVLPGRVRRGYGLGSVATGAFGTVPGLLLLPYLTDRLGIAAGLAGLIVLLPKAWDVLLNPIAGRVSDRSTHPDGRRRPFLVRAGLTLAVLFALLFAGPTSPSALAAGWVAVLFLACASAYAFFQVPYVAMPAELTRDYGERTRLMTWRVAVLALTILVAGGLSPALRDALGPEWGYRAVGVFVSLLIVVGAVGAWWGTKGVPPVEHVAAGGSLAHQLRVVAGAPDFRALLLTFAVQALATGVMLAGVDYMARWVLGDPGAATILFVAFVGPALVVTPLWERVGRRTGKRPAFVVASLCLAVGAVLVWVTHDLGLAPVALALALVGVGYAGAQMFPMAMLPDAAAVDADRTGESRVGVATSGGTESLVLAVLAARNGSPHVERPQVVAPSTVHAAVHKAGHLLGVDVVIVPVDPTTFRADPMAMAAAVTDDTVLLVASAPSYAHGVVDPVEEVAAIAREHGIRCHVDACIGGWVLPFLDDAPPWTFAVVGVTSISVDLHKYAYTPKGVSLLLHRDPALRRGHVYASAAWPGYTMLNTTLQSTKSGGPLAAAWAVVHAIGLERYRELAGVARRATLDVAAAVEAIDGLQVVVAPDSTLLALEATSGCDVFTVADEMASRGWLVQPQMAFAGHPATVHLTLCAATAAHTDELVAALTQSVAAARESGPVVVDPDLVAAAGQIDPAGLDEATLDGLLAIAGLGGGDGPLQVPDRMAEVNALLDAVPAALREALLAAVLDRLTR